MVPVIPDRQYNLAITNLHDVSLAIKINANLGQHGGDGGFITWDGRTYRVDVSGTVTRQFSGTTLSRVASATWDFFARGSFTSRAQIIGDIIFGRQSAVLPMRMKICTPHFLSAFATKLETAKVDLSRVQCRRVTNVLGLKTKKLIEPKVPEIATSEGRAKKLSRRIVVRNWLDQTIEDPSIFKSVLLSPQHGHSSIEVSNLSGRVKSSNYLGSWRNEDGSLGLFFSYKKEKNLRISVQAEDGLRDKTREFRPFQYRVKNIRPGKEEFGTSASSKIYLPCFGINLTKDRYRTPIKVLFGLSEQAADEAVTVMKQSNGLRYGRISRDRNCAGVALKMLLAAGASKFVPRPKAEFFYTPLQVEQYTRDLQQYLDWINAYTDQLIYIVGSDVITDVNEFLASNKKVFDAWTGAPRPIKSCMAGLQRDLHHMSKEEQMSQAKILVEFLADEIGENPATAFSKGTLSGASKAKRDGLLSIIKMVNLIRENVCKSRDEIE